MLQLSWIILHVKNNTVLQSIGIEREKREEKSYLSQMAPRQVAEPPAPTAPIGSRSDAEAAAGAPAAPPS
jgi:hypothetical protein